MWAIMQKCKKWLRCFFNGINFVVIILVVITVLTGFLIVSIGNHGGFYWLLA